jgi:hypothetical protein
MTAPKVRLVPRQVQLRLDEPTDAELLALLRAERDAATEEAWYDATDAITDLYRSLERPADLRVMDRVGLLRAQMRAEVAR